ncbi:hypothetical protein Cgig2_000159 [Carnegiea gigantea]|uniref:Leucine-rich repeat-containing N-terminal plant-type domain-containing protein n=1 Tax=Carnegiea gigantea TaxID=171969 RepID=A0A9Q1JRV3_9CARY|nr:hypothetical protein Cgig2_000159 [Carnegiea gigantea]
MHSISSKCLDYQKSLLIEFKDTLEFDHSYSTKLMSWREDMNFVFGAASHIAPVACSKCSSLQRWNLANKNGINGMILVAFGKLAGLTYLNLFYRGFTGQVPIEISSLLTFLKLGMNDLQVPVPKPIFQLSGLESLLRFGDMFNGALELNDILCPPKNLKTLDLSNNFLSINTSETSKTTDSCFPNYGNDSKTTCLLQGVEVSDIGNNQFNDTFPCKLKSLSKLRILVRRRLTMKSPPCTSWRCVLLFAFMSTSMGIHSVSGLCLDDQKSLLVDLRNTLEFNRSTSTKLVTWNSSTDCCLWGGVTCHSSSGQVIGLDLSGEGLSGPIDKSSSLFKMQSLQSLNLAYNRYIDGTIPSRIGTLSGLTYLNLSRTGFAGQVPIGISHLVRLHILDISQPFFWPGTFSLCMKSPNLATLVQNMTNLRELHVDGIDLSANGKRWFEPLLSSLSHLRVLSMSICNITTEFPRSLAKLYSLSVIRLDNNDLPGTVPESLASLKNLETLTLRNSRLIGTFPEEILQMPTLSTLDLSDNGELQGMLPDFVQNASLQTLLLNSTKFSGPLPTSIGNLKKLQTVDLSYCSFRGVIPSSIVSLNQLEFLDLSSNLLFGPIPSFSSAKNMRKLHLSSNKLNGSITSTEWEGLSNLESLDLSNNSLTGSIPTSLFYLPSLKNMQMSKNKFSGQLNEFESMPSSMLDTVDLSSNNLEGPVPKSIFQLRGLVSLSLSGNKFNGTLQLHEILSPLKDLKYLFLSDNFLYIDTRVNPAAENSSFPQLWILRLASCNLGILPEFLRNQSELLDLDLSNNHIQGMVPKWIWAFSEGLFYLNLSCNNFVELERPISPAPALNILDLHSNNIQGELPSQMFEGRQYMDCSSNKFTSIDAGSDLSSAVFLSLARNDIHGSIPTSLCNATDLEVLDLEDNHFKGTIPHCLIAGTPNLHVLNAKRNNLSGLIPDKIGKICKFQTLNFNGNFLQGQIPRSIVHCKELKVIDFGNNQLNDTFPCELKRLSKLQVLILRSNKFSGSIDCPKQNSTWPSLQILDLASNHFSGDLKAQYFAKWSSMMAGMNESQTEPDHLQYRPTDEYGLYEDRVGVTFKGRNFELTKILRIFTSIDLSKNAFHGEIPVELVNLNALIVLNLSYNSLSGKIPSSLGNLQQLESLDLSCNTLNGNIPQELAKLYFLEYLNLSFNKLAGPIPIGTQLQSFSASSYEGNLGLYGPPLTTSSRSKHAPGLTLPTSLEESACSSTSEVEWMLRGAEIGFPVGLTIFIGPLLYIRRWRQWYCEQLDRIAIKIRHKEDRTSGRRRRRRRQKQIH